MSSETIPGGATKTQNGDWVNANGEPLTDDQIASLEGKTVDAMVNYARMNKEALLELAVERKLLVSDANTRLEIIAALEA